MPNSQRAVIWKGLLGGHCWPLQAQHHGKRPKDKPKIPEDQPMSVALKTPPPTMPDQQDSPDLTDALEHNESLADQESNDSKGFDLIATLPEKFHFLLVREVDFEKRQCTKKILTKVITHFHLSWKPSGGARNYVSKRFLVGQFLEKVKPHFDAYLDELKETEALVTSKAQKSESNVNGKGDTINLSGINPNNPSITVEIILDIIAELKPKVKLPETMSKHSAIVAYHQHVMAPPVGGYPPPFTCPPYVVPAPYHRYLTRDEL
ncbi:hypothetical protein PtA15_17A112 [Puccinia triticina]|uniref:Uncharacterized protein n=1 Tax=Puccinia triticina TaxID=208348 RepID=A0ABY7D9E4_9BASI|nr:uncharacterized protein PtA15_17A112 [Puccinia triticina]WAQ92630.1 hypothetical protein PtA15_17A112 [Puccinia triticina]